MNTRLRIALACSVALAVLVYIVWPDSTDEAALILYGNVDIREVQLGFRVPGRVEKMHFEEGDAVTAGTVLATLDSKPMVDGLALAEAMVAQEQARLSMLRTGSRPQEIQQAEARVEEAEAALANAAQEYKRQQELSSRGLSSQQLLDGATAQRDQAAARLAANREALALAVEGARTEDIAAGEAAFAAAVAQRELAKTQLEDTQLRAPNPGVILTRVREPGAIVAAGVPVYALSLTDTVYVRAYVSEPDLGRVVPGAKVLVSTDSSAQQYVGQVGFISPRAEFTPKSVETAELRTDLVYRLRIVIANADTGLRQGMPVTVSIAPGKPAAVKPALVKPAAVKLPPTP